MEITISESHHPGGIPSVGSGVDIDFGSIRIGLNREDYQKLTEVISASVATNLKTMTEKYDAYWERSKKNYEFIKEFRKIFYNGDDDDDYFVQRPKNEIDQDRLNEALEKYKSFLGLE